MKIGSNRLKMSSGEVRTFRSEAARSNFERVAEAYKHGWRPTGKKKGTGADLKPSSVRSGADLK